MSMIEYKKVANDIVWIYVELCHIGTVTKTTDGFTVFLDDHDHFPDVSVNEAICLLMNK